MIYLTVLSSKEFDKLRREKFIIKYGFHKGPFGKCLIGLHGRKICHLSFVTDNESKNLKALKQQWSGAEFYPDRSQTGAVFEKIFSGKCETYEVLLKGTPFETKVWEELLNIPEGTTVSYQDIAVNIGHNKAVRAVANAVAKNFVAYLIPCHRVISKNGSLHKYRWGVDIKKKILESEDSDLYKQLEKNL